MLFFNTNYIHKHNVIFNKTVTKLITISAKSFFSYLNPTSYLNIVHMNHVINKGTSKALTNNFFKKMKTGAYSKRLTLSPLGFNPVLRNPCLILLGQKFLNFLSFVFY